MKKLCSVLIALVAVGVVCGVMPGVKAQEPAASNTTAAAVDDRTLVDIVEAVQAFIGEQPPGDDNMRVFDPVKGQVVTLKFKKVIASDAACFKKGTGGYAALCGDFKAEDGDDYVLWFVVKQQTEREEAIVGSQVMKLEASGQWTVRDVIIKSVNGQRRNDWIQDAANVWVHSPDTVSHKR
jgi:hypothetical protein